MDTTRTPEGRFAPGVSGNPAGRPVGSRNKLQTDFLTALSDDFAKGGREALERCRVETPAQYVRAIAALMPKEFEVRRPFDDIDDDTLDAAIIAVQAILAAQGDAAGAGDPPAAQLAGELPPLPEAG